VDVNEFNGEIIFKVLGWGTAVYILIIGFASSQHHLFELNTPEEQHRLYDAQIVYAEVLDGKSDRLKERDLAEATKLNVDAAKIRMEVAQVKNDESDSWYRAVALIIASLIYSVIYPLIIWFAYRRTDPKRTPAERYPIPLRVALIYGVTMSLLTSVTAAMTAYQ
jgi:hypothetical protein